MQRLGQPELAKAAKRSKRRAIDDAGEPIGLINLRDLATPDGEPGRAMQRFVKQLGAAARREGGLSNRGQVIVAVLTVGFLVGWNLLRSRLALPAFVTLPTFLALLIVAVGVSWAVTRRVGLRLRRSGIARAVAARGYCGGCGYDLRVAAEAKPRFVECPECSARWSPDRLLSSRPEQHTWETLGRRHGRVPANRRLAHDDRGAIIRRIRSVPWRAPKAGRRAWSADQRRAMRRARRRCGIIWRVLVSLVGLGLVSIMAMLIVTASQDFSGPPQAIFGVFFGMIGLLIIASAWIGETGVANDRFAALSRDAGVCAACSTPIDHAPVDGDGFSVCTRCGSSWNPDGTG